MTNNNKCHWVEWEKKSLRLEFFIVGVMAMKLFCLEFCRIMWKTKTVEKNNNILVVVASSTSLLYQTECDENNAKVKHITAPRWLTMMITCWPSANNKMETSETPLLFTMPAQTHMSDDKCIFKVRDALTRYFVVIFIFFLFLSVAFLLHQPFECGANLCLFASFHMTNAMA